MQEKVWRKMTKNEPMEEKCKRAGKGIVEKEKRIG
jgi:hypothetical protein